MRLSGIRAGSIMLGLFMWSTTALGQQGGDAGATICSTFNRKMSPEFLGTFAHGEQANPAGLTT